MGKHRNDTLGPSGSPLVLILRHHLTIFHTLGQTQLIERSLLLKSKTLSRYVLFFKCDCSVPSHILFPLCNYRNWTVFSTFFSVTHLPVNLGFKYSEIRTTLKSISPGQTFPPNSKFIHLMTSMNVKSS